MANWQAVPGTSATSIGGGADGSIWHVGGNAKIYKWTGGGWQPGPDCDAVSVAVEPSGKPWHVGTNRGIYRWTGASWAQFAGAAAIDLAIGADGTIVHIGTNNVVYRWDGAQWAPFAGTFATSCAVDRGGRVWHRGQNNDVYYFDANTNSWRGTGAIATSVAAGANGTVAHVGMKSFGVAGDPTPWTIYRWNGGGWDLFDGNEWMQIAIDSAGTIWARDAFGNVSRSI